MRLCQICRSKKRLEEFGNNKKRPEGKQLYCKECSREKDRKSYKTTDRPQKIRERDRRTLQENRQFLYDYLLSHSCIDCGESDPVVLEFDHVRGKKTKGISLMKRHSQSSLIAELKKCEVRCANCHKRRTAKQQKWFKGKSL